MIKVKVLAAFVLLLFHFHYSNKKINTTIIEEKGWNNDSALICKEI
jgi:hypothetical protein